jgi:hypothetical protein
MKHHHLTTPNGRELGLHLARLTNPTIFQLSLEGEPDTRCTSCAFTLGTVPNGCPQTQMDAFKCVMEGVPFYCHVKRPERTSSSGRVLCHGWYAARVALGGATHPAPWPFSTDEPPPEPGEGEL